MGLGSRSVRSGYGFYTGDKMFLLPESINFSASRSRERQNMNPNWKKILTIWN